MAFPRAEPAASRCSGRIQPGAASLMSWCVLESKTGGKNWGIYNCRQTAGGSRSVHGDGRALDIGYSGVSNPAGTRLVQRLLPHVGRLGIQRIIWNRRVWDARSPGGRAYGGGGLSPHTDHVHIELTWASARQLNLATIRAVMRSPTAIAAVPKPQPVTVAKPAPTPAPPPPPAPPKDEDMYFRDSHGRIWHVSGMWFRHLTPSQWKAEQLLNSAKAADITSEKFMTYVSSRGLLPAK
jgi:hypothetical protein